jgi:hypothetical protein
MDTPDKDSKISHSVSVDSVDGKWVVTIVDSGESHVREFEIEAFALSFAEGQRHRLGLAQPGEALSNANPSNRDS